VPATQIGTQHTNAQNWMSVFWAPVPAGTTATVVVTWTPASGTLQRGGAIAYTTTDDVTPRTPFYTDAEAVSGATGPFTLDLGVTAPIPAGSFVVGAAMAAISPAFAAGVWSWSGLAEDIDDRYGADNINHHSAASATVSAAAASLPVSATISAAPATGNIFQPLGLAVVFEPNAVFQPAWAGNANVVIGGGLH
jgi:hypothetical protein